MATNMPFQGAHVLRRAGGSRCAAGLSAGQSGCLVADDDRVGRRVGPPQQQRVGRVLRRHEEVDRLARAAHRAHVDLALVDVALENDLARGIHHARGRSPATHRVAAARRP